MKISELWYEDYVRQDFGLWKKETAEYLKRAMCKTWNEVFKFNGPNNVICVNCFMYRKNGDGRWIFADFNETSILAAIEADFYQPPGSTL